MLIRSLANYWTCNKLKIVVWNQTSEIQLYLHLLCPFKTWRTEGMMSSIGTKQSSMIHFLLKENMGIVLYPFSVQKMDSNSNHLKHLPFVTDHSKTWRFNDKALHTISIDAASVLHLDTCERLPISMNWRRK